ncbi:hypothetical protein EB796_021017 [Bugula neritina]|uniref:Uncharacterized protein n=1 Tax=Bugula neritina TaxID=10212 RepID=A0A7J7J485_BUGNE|nr:hypothetical protein EB796_021017 [Bugula neritina]
MSRRKLCQICGGKAYKRYFGVVSCENCKEFYKYSVRTGKLYVCSGNKEGEEQQCSINLKADTEPCKRCLFDKCKAKGMTRLDVKLYQRFNRRQLPIKTPGIIKQLVRVYFSVFQLQERQFQAKNAKPLLLSDTPLEKSRSSYKASMFSQLCSQYEPLIYKMVKFFSRVPEFSTLPSDDQLILLKTGFIDAWLVLNARNLSIVQDSLTLCDGAQIPVCEFTTVYTKDYVTSLLELSDDFRVMKLLPYDRAVILALVVLCSDRPNLIATDKVKEMKDSLLKSFRQFLQLTRPSNTNLYTKITNLLSSIYDIGKQHALLMNMYRAELDNLHVSSVITELFDLHPPHAYKES